MNGLVFAAVAPHGYLALSEAVPESEMHLGEATRQGMAELARRFDAAQPGLVVILTPHNVHVEGHFAVLTSAFLSGTLDDWISRPVAMKVTTNQHFARELLGEARRANLPAVGVSYGGNDAGSATAPLDWGSLIPLWFMGGRSEPGVPVVIVTPARDLSDEQHRQLGASIGRSALNSGERVALIASADHGHAHAAQGPYGFAPESREYDEAVCGMLRKGSLHHLTQLSAPLVSAAKADSYWQLLILQGALEATGRSWSTELLSYEVPTYFGMACASFIAEPVPRETS